MRENQGNFVVDSRKVLVRGWQVCLRVVNIYTNELFTEGRVKSLGFRSMGVVSISAIYERAIVPGNQTIRETEFYRAPPLL